MFPLAIFRYIMFCHKAYEINLSRTGIKWHKCRKKIANYIVNVTMSEFSWSIISLQVEATRCSTFDFVHCCRVRHSEEKSRSQRNQRQMVIESVLVLTYTFERSL